MAPAVGVLPLNLCGIVRALQRHHGENSELASYGSGSQYHFGGDPTKTPHGGDGEDRPMNLYYTDFAGVFDGGIHNFPSTANRLCVLMISLQMSTQPELYALRVPVKCHSPSSVGPFRYSLDLLGLVSSYHLAKTKLRSHPMVLLNPQPRAPWMVCDPQK